MALSPDREVRWGLESRSGARPDARAARAPRPEILRSEKKRQTVTPLHFVRIAVKTENPHSTFMQS
jgi:hypothetical protein